jgi:hypothetical protein
MTLDRKLNILGHTFTVEQQQLGPELAGESNSTDLLIKINYGLVDAVKVETFYHEVVHMMLDLGGYSTLLEPKLEEAMVQFLGNAIAQFVSSNDALPIISKEGE